MNEANINETANLKEKLLEEERKNIQMQQCIQQMKQQHAQLMAQLGSSNNDSFNPEATSNSTDDRSNLLIETGRKESSRMKQLEVQVQQMQEEMNKAAAAAAMHHTVEMSSSNIQSAQVSPHLANSSHLPASSSSNLNTQYELLKANERFLKEKVRF